MEQRWKVLMVTSIGAFMAQLDLFIVNIAFPAIPRTSPAAPRRALLGAERLRDRLRRLPGPGRPARRPDRPPAHLQLGVRSSRRLGGLRRGADVAVLVAARVVQAVGAAMVIPTSLGLLLHAFPPTQRAARPACGPAQRRRRRQRPADRRPAGALSWRWIFLVNLPLAWSPSASPADPPEVRHPDGRPDLPGRRPAGARHRAVSSSAIVEGPGWGWATRASRPRSSARSPCSPCFSTAAHTTLRRSSSCRCCAASVRGRQCAMLAFYVGFGAMLLGGVLFLTGVWGYSELRAGFALSPGPLMAAGLRDPLGPPRRPHRPARRWRPRAGWSSPPASPTSWRRSARPPNTPRPSCPASCSAASASG